MNGLGREAILALFRRVVGLYFRDIEVVGQVPPPQTAGRVFAANHVNGLVDPVLVLTHAACPVAPVGKSTLWKIPVLKWLLDAVDAVPVTRRRDEPTKTEAANEQVFDAVAQHLARGGNMLIFPEGTSHNEPHVVPLKSGVGRMLARAHARGTKGLTFQAVGLEFDARDLFRSRALVVYGPVRSVDQLGLSGEALVKKITEQLREDLSELVVEGDTWDERLSVARIAEMFANDAGDRSLAGWNEIGRQVEAAKRVLEKLEPTLAQEIADGTTKYYAALEEAGLRDEDIVDARGREPARDAKMLRLGLTLPLAIPGFALYALPYQVPRLVARHLAKKQGTGAVEHDEISTYKVAAGLVVYPLWAAGLVGASFVLLPRAAAVAASAVVLASPFAALEWLDYLDERARRPGAFSLHREDTTLAALRSSRASLKARLDAARALVAAAA